ncbi:MAG: LytR/AlgR family response regulator transcription factor [Ruminococcus sp.]|jgi:DNA-binding LytR/AlgR family response regulator
MDIAICDDNKEERKELRNMLEKIWKDVRITEGSDGQDLLNLLEAGETYDLVFLDIFMDRVGGMEAGRIIRSRYPRIEVVLVSVSREFGPEAFELNAFYYLVKPYQEKLLRKVKERFQKINDSRIEVYDVNSRQKQRIPYRKITYIESMRNYLYVHMDAGPAVKLRESLQSFMERLDERFLKINRGVIVNMEAVEKMDADSCEVDGVVFMLSRRQRVENRRKYNDFLFQHYMEGQDY